MKEVAYRTECCNKLFDLDSCFGIISDYTVFGVEFVTVTPERSNVHYCIDCYNKNVTEAVEAQIKHELTNAEKFINTRPEDKAISNKEMYEKRKAEIVKRKDELLKEYSSVFKKRIFFKKS